MVDKNNRPGKYRMDTVVTCENKKGKLPQFNFDKRIHSKNVNNISNVKLFDNLQLVANWSTGSAVEKHVVTPRPLNDSVPHHIITVEFDASAEPSFRFQVRVLGIKDDYDTCVEQRECTKILWSTRTQGGDLLRSRSDYQLQCLTNDSNLPSQLDTACTEWTNCLDSQTNSSTANLTLLLRVGALHGSQVSTTEDPLLLRVGALHGGRVSTTEDHAGCFRPDLAFVEEWICDDCYKRAEKRCESECAGVHGSLSLCENCFGELLCRSCSVCESWKDEKECSLTIRPKANECNRTAALVDKSLMEYASSETVDSSILRKSTEC